MVGPIDVKQNEMSQLDATLPRVPLTFTLTLIFDLTHICDKHIMVNTSMSGMQLPPSSW